MVDAVGLRRHVAVLIGFYLLGPGSLLGSQQSQACDVEVGVNVIGRTGGLVQGLTADSFVIQKTKTPASIKNAAYDTGPRRVVLVLDRGTQMNKAAARASEAIIGEILGRASGGDSFALITVGQYSNRTAFGQSPAELLQRLHDPEQSSQWLGMIDAIAAAAEWLNPPQTGDSIFVFSGEDDLGRAGGSFRKLYGSLLQHQIRLFAVLLGPVINGEVDTVIDWRAVASGGPPLVTNTVWAETEDLAHLSWGTGGYLIRESMWNPQREYKLTDARVEQLKHQGWQMYGAIAEYYRLQIAVTPSGNDAQKWELGLNAATQKKTPQAMVLRPELLPARCGQ